MLPQTHKDWLQLKTRQQQNETKQKIASVNKDVNILELLYIPYQNMKWFSTVQNSSVLIQNVNIRVITYSNSSTLDI